MDGRPEPERRADAVTALRKAFEAYFHSDEDVARYLDTAARIVYASEVPDALHEAAFVQAVGLLAQKQVTFEEVTGAGVLLSRNGPS